MTLFVVQQEQETVHVPEWVTDIESFRRWARSDDFPRRGWYAHLNGALWVDPNMERLAHNQVKNEIGTTLTILVRQAAGGRFIGDRMLLTHKGVGLSTEPDAMFLSRETVRAKRAVLAHGDDALEVVGTPDMVLEVVSPSSRQKDTVVLRDLYWRAGIAEYWLADPGRDELRFDILRRGPKGYVAARRQQGGWLKSGVFERSFRLTRSPDPDDQDASVYRFEVQER